jgi:hypothetical protein
LSEQSLLQLVAFDGLLHHSTVALTDSGLVLKLFRGLLPEAGSGTAPQRWREHSSSFTNSESALFVGSYRHGLGCIHACATVDHPKDILKHSQRNVHVML